MAGIYNFSTIRKKRGIEVRAKKKIIKDKMTGRVDIVRRIYVKIAICFFMKFCVERAFLTTLHLGDFLEVLMVKFFHIP